MYKVWTGDIEAQDYLAANLEFYLASWVMYRDSSFFIKYTYKVHIAAIREIAKEEYVILYNISLDKLKKIKSC